MICAIPELSLAVLKEAVSPSILPNALFSVRLLCLTLVCFSVQSVAKEYSVETALRGSGEYDDNVRLDEEEISIAGIVISPELNAGLRTERLDLALKTVLDFARFDKSEYDSDDQDVALTSSYAFEYNVFNAAAQLKRNSTRTSEASDTGVFGVASRREDENLSLGWRHFFTDKHSLEMSATYADVEYASNNPNLNDYEYGGVAAAYSIDISDRTVFISQLEVSRFESNTLRPVLFGRFGIPVGAAVFPAEIQSDTYGLNVGIKRIVTETLMYSVAVGANYVETSFDSPAVSSAAAATPGGLDVVKGLKDEDDTSFFLSATFGYEGERATLSANVSSSTSPSANGYLLLANQLTFNFDYRLSERGTAFIKLDLIDSQSLGDAVNALDQSVSSNDRTYGAARVGGSYRLAESWYISASYRYRAQDREVFDDIAKSNALLLQIAYKPRKNIWSR